METINIPSMEPKHTRNSEVLSDFVSYCVANPDQRFWQALRNWSAHAFVCVTDHINFDTSQAYVQDTFSWEGRVGNDN